VEMGWLLQEWPCGVCYEGTSTSVTQRRDKGVEDLVDSLSAGDEFGQFGFMPWWIVFYRSVNV
jgi:hypothetical protein